MTSTCQAISCVADSANIVSIGTLSIRANTSCGSCGKKENNPVLHILLRSPWPQQVSIGCDSFCPVMWMSPEPPSTKCKFLWNYPFNIKGLNMLSCYIMFCGSLSLGSSRLGHDCWPWCGLYKMSLALCRSEGWDKTGVMTKTGKKPSGEHFFFQRKERENTQISCCQEARTPVEFLQLAID